MSIFNTQADTYQNSFANPMNPANMNPGWGIDPNLLTPSYTASYRPQYAGPAPYNQYGRTGFFAGINHLANPFAPDARWGNPVDNNASAIEGISSRPFDSVVWAGQRAVAPVMAYGLAFGALGARSGFGSGPAWGLGRSFGRGLGTGFVNAFSARGAESLLGRGIVAGSGALFGAAASIAIPYAVGTAMLEGGQRAIFNPYINNRMTARDLRQNFSGITFGDSSGNAVTGGGLGYRESSRIASDITLSGVRDMTFSTAEYSRIADYSGRSGLLDTANSGQIAGRVKGIAEQIKLIMSIAKDPSIQGAIEELSRLQMAGAGISGGSLSVASGAYRQIGQYAAIAGRSVQNVMNTVGAQGQYLYQANGMTPYLGQIAAANVMASFGAAQRVGMMSPAQLARMGGVEGASQASLTGQINAGQSLYNKMALYNTYLGGAGGTQGFGSNQSVTGIVSRFGTDFAKDPLGAYGATMLYGRQMLGKQMQERGSLAIEDQAVSILRNLAAPRDDKGQYSAAQLMPVLKMLGMSDDEAIAYINQRSSESSPDVANQKIRALTRFNEEQKRSMISQNFLYGGAIGSTARGAMKLGRSITGALGSVMTDITEVQGAFGDKVQSGADWLQFGVTLTGNNVTVKDYDKFFRANTGNAQGEKLNLIDVDGSLTSKVSMSGGLRALHNVVDSNVLTQKQSAYAARRINAMAKAGDKDAIAFLNSTNPQEKRSALGRLLANRKEEFGNLGDQITNSANGSVNADQFLSDLAGFGTKSYTTTAGDTLGLTEFEKVLRRSTLNDSTSDGSVTEDIGSLKAIGQASELLNQTGADSLNQFNIDEKLNDDKYSDLRRIVGGKKGSAAYDVIQKIYRKSAKEGTQMLGSAAYTSGIKATGDFSTDRKALQQLIESNNGVALTTGISSAESIGLDDLKALQSKDSDFIKQRGQILEMLKNHRVDYATAQNTMNTLDDSKNVKDFGEHVKNFGDAVQELKGSGKTPSSDNPPSIFSREAFNHFFGSDNQRSNGSPLKK